MKSVALKSSTVTCSIRTSTWTTIWLRRSPTLSWQHFSGQIRSDQARANIAVRGTSGYVAPERFKNMGITAKVDVYNFGVTLLEIVCCRKLVEPELDNGEATILTNWVNTCYRNGSLGALVEGDEELGVLRREEGGEIRDGGVALWCVQEEPSLRPTMLKVTRMLDGTVPIPVPPEPSSYISSIQ